MQKLTFARICKLEQEKKSLCIWGIILCHFLNSPIFKGSAGNSINYRTLSTLVSYSYRYSSIVLSLLVALLVSFRLTTSKNMFKVQFLQKLTFARICKLEQEKKSLCIWGIILCHLLNSPIFKGSAGNSINYGLQNKSWYWDWKMFQAPLETIGIDSETLGCL